MSREDINEELAPRQSAFLKNYLDPTSETWGNATQSAVKAGYTQEYAENLTTEFPKWLQENLGDTTLVEKALVNLNTALTEDDKNIKWDATKFTLSRLAKARFSERKEMTGANGEALVVEISEAIARKNGLS